MPRPIGYNLNKHKVYLAILLVTALSIAFCVYLQSSTVTMATGEYSLQGIPIDACFTNINQALYMFALHAWIWGK